MKHWKKQARAAAVTAGLTALLIWTILSVPGSTLRAAKAPGGGPKAKAAHATAKPKAKAAKTPAVPLNFTVMNLNDSGPGSLRDAIDQANMTMGADTIDFADELAGTITLTSGELLITDDLDINGPGAPVIIVSGNQASRVFEISSGVTASIAGLTISDGSSSQGGGVANGGTLTLARVVVANNSANMSMGGGIFNASGASLTITESTVSGNSAGSGGGVYNNSSATLSVTGSTFSGNLASTGAGIANAAALTVINSTVSGNTASTSGGGILNSGGTANISFTTVANNGAPSGGGLFNSGGTTNIKNSIVANSTSGGDCSNSGTLNATGVNFTTSGTCPGFTQVTSAQLHLGPLQDNGGFTQTHALLAGSVAIDAATDCTAIGGASVSTDQRGVGRPQGAACDVGAYEAVPCNTPPTITCPDNFSQSTDPNKCTAVVDFALPAADCPCSPIGGRPTPLKVTGPKKPRLPKQVEFCSVSCAPPPGSTFPKGTSTINCTATDAQGNTAQCSFTVTVNDTQPPTLACPAITRSTDPNQCSAVVNYTVPANDNCDGPLTPSCSPPSGTTFPKGTATVNCTVTDSSGNTATCSFPVTVNDTQPPAITCPANITAKTATVGAACVVVNYTTPTATDNCPLPPNPVVCSPASGTCFARGVTTVTCTATDASSNITQCSFTVTVFDVCLQDDSDPSTVVLVNTATGDYRFCCHGTVFTGRGKITVRGGVYTLQQDATDRRVLVTSDENTHRGSASLQVPPGVTRCTITDRDNRNNSCVCQ